MTRPKLNQLEMLAAVADHGSFGAAAAQLDCTQSRISHAITELEQALGARLLVRSRTGCTPNEAGQRVLASARQILALADNLASDAAGSATLAGHVRIACFRSIGTHLLPAALEALATSHPALRIDIDDSFEERDGPAAAVRDGLADIAIAQLPVAGKLAQHAYIADDYVLVAPSGLALKAPLTWNQLGKVDYLQLNCPGALAMLALCREAGWNAQPARLLATDSGIVAMVRKGLGFTILPRLAIYPEPDGVKVMPLPFLAQRPFAIVAQPAAARTEAIKAVMQQLRKRKLVESTEAFRAGLVAWAAP